MTESPRLGHEEPRDRDMAAISEAIDYDRTCGLSVEILLWAFYHVQDHPTCTIAEAIQVGFDEWVK